MNRLIAPIFGQTIQKKQTEQKTSVRSGAEVLAGQDG